jgi:DNA-binding MarR family transcriptional regulator
MSEPADSKRDGQPGQPVPLPLGASLCWQLVVVGGDLAELFERLTRRYGLTLVQFNTLDLVTRLHPDPQEPWQLAQVLAIGSNHVTMVLDRLEDQELVTRGPHPHDRRRRLVRVTAAGKELAERIRESLRDVETELVDSALQPDEQRELERLSAQLRHAIRERVIPVRGVRPGP